MLTLGEDLLLLALDADRGAIHASAVLPYGLHLATMIDAAADGHLTLTPTPRFTVALPVIPPATPPSDLLKTLIEDLREAQAATSDRSVRTILQPSASALHHHLGRARRNALLTWDPPRNPVARYGRFRLQATDAAAEARACLARVATTPDTAGDRDLTLAAIAHALGLTPTVFPGRRNRARRAALAAAVADHPYAVLLARTLPKDLGAVGQVFTFDPSNDMSLTSGA